LVGFNTPVFSAFPSLKPCLKQAPEEQLVTVWPRASTPEIVRVYCRMGRF